MEIKRSKYQGYVWFSDSKSPVVLMDQEYELSIDESQNPFVVEAYLFSSEDQMSHLVKYVDGAYRHIVHDLNAKTSDAFDEKVFFAVKEIGKQMLFRQYWRKEADANCEGMEVLVPAESVFVGFKEMED